MKLSQQIFQKKIHPKHLVTSIVNDIMQENRSFDDVEKKFLGETSFKLILL